MVIRDLTLRSAASFGSFHLIRLLYDEYMFYLVEHKVASSLGLTPIAVMSQVRVDVGGGGGRVCLGGEKKCLECSKKAAPCESNFCFIR